MTTTRRTRFALEELQPRYALAVLAYDAPVGNGADVITVRLNGNKFEIEVAGERMKARASLKPMYDPTSERMRV